MNWNVLAYGEDPFREAIGVLEMISKTPDDYQYYEDRLKFLRDEEAKLADAKELEPSHRR